MRPHTVPIEARYNEGELAVVLLAAYQDWCGEHVKTPERALEIYRDLREAIGRLDTKKEAVASLVNAEWGTTHEVKPLVDAIWKYQENANFHNMLSQLAGGPD